MSIHRVRAQYTTWGQALLLCLVLALGAAVPAWAAETINYPANGSLRDLGYGMMNGAASLAPTDPSGNSVTVGDTSSSTAPDYVFGGVYIGSVSNNQVFILNGAVAGTSGNPSILGGYVTSFGSAVNNSVTVSGGTAKGSVMGALVSEGNATNNRVTITGGIVDSGQGINGAQVLVSGSASGNSVTITGGTVAGNNVTGGNSPAVATGNSVNISGNVQVEYVYGGRSSLQTATGNSVNIYGNAHSTRTVYGGESKGVAGNGGATGNSVVIADNAQVDGPIYGGGTDNDAASGNSVTISGNARVSTVFGGWSDNGDAIGNTVTISGSPTISGGLAGGVALGGTSSGNTLNMRTAGVTVANIGSFQNLNFYLPSTLAAGGTVLTTTGIARIDGSTVNVGIEGGSSPLKQGDSIVLIDAGTLNGTPANTTANGQGMQGVTLRYSFDILTQGNQLLAMVTSAGANPQLKSLSEGRLAGHAFLNQGSDLIIGPGMYSILAAPKTEGGLVPFAVGQGGWSRYNTGSHVDVSGASMLTGLAWRQPINEGKAGSVLAGAFFEAGWGGYDSHNSFSNAASVKGDGDISYYGGGILGRYDFAPTGPGNVYVDASFRAGHVSTDFNSSDLVDNAGRKADYDSGSAYYGAHAGLGYVWNITDKASLDLSTRYLWTHQDSDSVKVLGDPIRFKAVDSQRWRTGARFSYAVNDYVAPYAGAYYDHEFDGKARASTNGYKIDAPDLKGGTGVGELGLSIKPVKDSGFSMDFGVQGYTGVREGVTGSLQLKFEF